MRSTLLIVEDDDVYRESFQRLLGDDYTLMFAETLAAARVPIQHVVLDCVLLDYRLPDGEGITLLPELVDAHVPVVICTAQGSESVAVRALKEGADDYLTKNNLKKMDLCRAIENAMERARLRSVVRERDTEKDILIKQLQVALEDIETLHGLIPICSQCKKVRDDEGYWHVVEAYLSKRTHASFTHGYCPDCYKSEFKRGGGKE